MLRLGLLHADLAISHARAVGKKARKQNPRYDPQHIRESLPMWMVSESYNCFLKLVPGVHSCHRPIIHPAI